MRFAVHRPGIPVASPRSHGVSRRDVDGRVHVSVAGVSAGSAHESRLALARPRGNGSEGEMPTTRPVHPHSIRLHAYGYGARPPETYPSSLRYPHLSNLAGQAAHVPLVAPPHNPESFIPPGFAPRRPSGRTLRVEECGCRLSKVSQGLLLHRLGACTQPVMLGSGFGELPRLLQVARRARTARAPVLMLLHGEIPHIPSMGAVVPQHRHLGGRGKQPVLGHANTLATTSDIYREVKRRFLPFAMTEGSAPGTR